VSQKPALIITFSSNFNKCGQISTLGAQNRHAMLARNLYVGVTWKCARVYFSRTQCKA